MGGPEDGSHDDRDVNDLVAARRLALDALSRWTTGSSEDPIVDPLSSGSRLLIKSIEEAERSESLSQRSMEDLGSRLDEWRFSLEPWQVYTGALNDLDPLAFNHLTLLLDSLTPVITAVFGHCKRSDKLYGSRFDDLRTHLTALYRRTNHLLESFFGLLDTKVNFNGERELAANALETVLEAIGNVATLSAGMDLRSLMNTWKVFAKLATRYESQLKTRATTERVTDRYGAIAKDIETLLRASLHGENDANRERAMKCVCLLLKILGRLCSLYSDNCPQLVFNVLVELLTTLYGYSRPFSPGETAVGRYAVAHVIPATDQLLTVLIAEKNFAEAFFHYGRAELEEPVHYHFLILRTIELLIDAKLKVLSAWLNGDTENIIDTALMSASHCCANFLIDDERNSSDQEAPTGRESGFYEISLKLLCRLINRADDHLAVIELALLKHLIGGEFWSAMLSCDVWTYLARRATAELRLEHLSFLIRVRCGLKARERRCAAFTFVDHLIDRLRKQLPQEAMRDFNRDYAIGCSNDPIAAARDPSRILQDLRRTASIDNWMRLTGALRSLGQGGSQHSSACVQAIGSVWSLVASGLSRSDGIVREMLLELADLLLEATCPDSAGDKNNDVIIASIYECILEMMDHAPIQHRLKVNIFLRDNLEPWINESGELSLAALARLFNRLASDNDPWLRQEAFETYAECIFTGSSYRIFDRLIKGIDPTSRAHSEMQSYLAYREIHSLARHTDLANYFVALASAARDTAHSCYRADFRLRDEKMPRRVEVEMEQRVERVCDELRIIAERRNELSLSSIDRLRAVLATLLE